MKSNKEYQQEWENEVVEFFEAENKCEKELYEGNNLKQGVIKVNDHEADLENVKQNVKSFFGLKNQEEYNNTQDNVVNNVMQNGVWGVVSGFLISTFAVASHIINVVIRNIMFGEAVHLNFSKAIHDAMAQQGLKGKTNELKKERKNEKNEKYERDRSEEKQVDPAKKEEVHKSKEKCKENCTEGIENILNLCKEDPEQMDVMLNSIIHCQNMEEFQKEFGVELFIDSNSDRVYVLNKDKENNLSNLPYVHKNDLLEGNAQALGAVFYDKDRSDGRDPSLAAAIDGAVFAAKFKNEAFSGILAEMRENISIEKSFIMSHLITESQNRTAGLMYATLSQANESIDIYYKSKLAGTIDLTESYEKISDKLYQQIAEIDEAKERYSIGDQLSFQKNLPDTVVVKINETEKEFVLKEQQDLKPIADFIAEACPDKADEATVDALLIGAKMNPYMDKTIDENGYQLNPFTGEPVDKGDLILTTDKDFLPHISEYNIEITSSVGMVGGSVEKIIPITSVNLISVKNDLLTVKEELLNHMEVMKSREIPEQLVAINSIVFDKVEKYVPKPMETLLVGDGKNIYEQLKENSLFDGKDLEDYNIKQEEEEYEEPPISEDMICEAQEAMREAGEELEI